MKKVEITEVVSQFIRNMIILSENPIRVIAGISNAFAHGEVLENIGWVDFGPNDQDLIELFEHFDKFCETLKKIKKRNE